MGQYYFSSKPLPSNITVEDSETPLVWQYERDSRGLCKQANFYFTRLWVALLDDYTAHLKRQYIYHLHINDDSFIGTGETLREAYDDALQTYRIEMKRRDDEARRINQIEMWGRPL